MLKQLLDDDYNMLQLYLFLVDNIHCISILGPPGDVMWRRCLCPEPLAAVPARALPRVFRIPPAKFFSPRKKKKKVPRVCFLQNFFMLYN